MRNPVILQISDLHFGRRTEPYRFWQPSINDQARQALKHGIMEFTPRPDFIVVTGDLSNRGRKSEFQEAKDFLESLLTDLWSSNHAARCIVIPGNHDVWRTTYAHAGGYFPRSSRLHRWDEVYGTWSFLSRAVDTDSAPELRPFSMYEYLLQHGGLGGAQLEPEAARSLQEKVERTCEYYPAFDVAFFKLDSNLWRKGWWPHPIARGRVGLEQRHWVDRVIRYYDAATANTTAPFLNARRIALVHHHITRLPNVKQENWMFMEDAGEVGRWLARIGVRLVLHGHYHVADLVGIKFWNTEANNSEVETIVVSAGSATAIHPDDGHNSCHHIRVEHFRTSIARLLLDHGEYQKVQAAKTYIFEHLPDLAIASVAPDSPPAFLEALEASIVGEERYADQYHLYDSIVSTGFVTNDRTYMGSVELSGTNVGSHETNGIPFLVTAVGAQEFSDCRCRAWDLLTGKELVPPELLERRPIHVFPCHVFFAAPLRPQQRFNVRVTFRLPMVMLEQRDFDMVSTVRFQRGINQLTMRLAAAKTIVGPSCWELRNDRLLRSSIPLAKATVKDPNSETTVDGYEISVSDPKALSYLIFYEKLR